MKLHKTFSLSREIQPQNENGKPEDTVKDREGNLRNKWNKIPKISTQ